MSTSKKEHTEAKNKIHRIADKNICKAITECANYLHGCPNAGHTIFTMKTMMNFRVSQKMTPCRRLGR